MKFLRREPFPGPYADPASHKPFLRVDFLYQCAYCNASEGYRRSSDIFGVDHFRPRSKFPTLTNSYSNLYYCCAGCNSTKGAEYPDEATGLSFVAPCAVDPFEADYRELPGGALAGLTDSGRFTIDVIALNRPACLAFRQRRRQTQQRLAQLEQFIRALALEHPGRPLLADLLEDLRHEWKVCYGNGVPE